MRNLLAAALTAVLGVAAAASAAAQESAGCAFLAGLGPQNVLGGAGAATSPEMFSAGETINLSVSTTGGGPGTTLLIRFFGSSGAVETTLAADGAGDIVRTIGLTIPADGSYAYVITSAFGGGSGSVAFIACTPPADPASEAQRTAAQNATLAFARQSDFVFGRTQQLAIRRPDRRQASVGAAGQGVDPVVGLWGDLAITGLEDRNATTRSETQTAAFVLGADVAASDRLLVGAAFTSSILFAQDDADDDDRFESDFGVLPYFAFQIDDRFSLQGAAGVSGAFGRTENDGAEADTRAFRYFLSAEAGYFESWGDFSLYTALSGLWGQSFQAAYTDDADQRVGSIRSRLGSLTFTAQPSYVFDWESQDGFVEPYALFSYSYDVTQSKTAGAANDPDAFDVGLGANLFFDGVAGTVEASRMLGRENVSATTGRMTVRVDF